MPAKRLVEKIGFCTSQVIGFVDHIWNDL